MKNHHRQDRDAIAQWCQLELAIPGVSLLIEGKSMDAEIYPEKKPSTSATITNEAAALTVSKGLHVTEPIRKAEA